MLLLLALLAAPDPVWLLPLFPPWALPIPIWAPPLPDRLADALPNEPRGLDNFNLSISSEVGPPDLARSSS